MVIFHNGGDFAVEQLPIEQIEPGDVIIADTDEGTPYLYQVNVKRFVHNRAAGESPMIVLEGEPLPGVEFVPQTRAPVGTLAHRVIPRPMTAEEPPKPKTGADPDFRHPKCYANTRGGCSTKISGEHFISHSLIMLYSFDDPDLKIKHDSGYGIREFVQPKKFVANILCEKHNNDLSRADDAALAFAKFMRTISMRYRGGAGEWGGYEEITISGDDFQAWVLKLILNHVVGKAFTHQKGEFVSPFATEAVDLLLGRAMWPETWGLCVAGDPANKDLRMNAFDNLEDVTTEWCTFQPFVFHPDVPGKANEVGGGIVNLNGVGFGLTVFNPGRDLPSFNKPENPLRGSLQRPEYMAWQINGVQKRVNFTWTDVWEHKNVTYTID
ncbi:hypothetical protein C3477_23260 [Mycobacterium kansasii]|uniref:hypothetical protein n=1 Tax=Mycobacterium kansasii TaxID=1768 RepID=UPI000CDD0A73|nr:hypothetical protein [Mycobacterium kansasii]POX86074.1 hypothetical protein C3B43_20240 [Mycobacterium kansasii]POX98792.1 hypothetical protein C3477_23260 [Mycobacterium kansasii]POY16398.1 hypothetical protein C3476_22835 [Mycobacterium kansasii]